jgi:hypothetical protein
MPHKEGKKNWSRWLDPPATVAGNCSSIPGMKKMEKEDRKCHTGGKGKE